MARKKRGSSKKSGGKPAVLSLGKKASKRGAKAKVGRTRGAQRKLSVKTKPKGRRY